MTRFALILGMLLANTTATSHDPRLTTSSTLVSVESSENCFEQYLNCSFRTDRPADEPDCYEQFVACLVPLL